MSSPVQLAAMQRATIYPPALTRFLQVETDPRSSNPVFRSSFCYWGTLHKSSLTANSTQQNLLEEILSEGDLCNQWQTTPDQRDIRRSPWKTWSVSVPGRVTTGHGRSLSRGSVSRSASPFCVPHHFG